MKPKPITLHLTGTYTDPLPPSLDVTALNRAIESLPRFAYAITYAPAFSIFELWDRTPAYGCPSYPNDGTAFAFSIVHGAGGTRYLAKSPAQNARPPLSSAQFAVRYAEIMRACSLEIVTGLVGFVDELDALADHVAAAEYPNL